MRAVPHWILWRHWWHQERERWLKMPLTSAMTAASVADRETWCTFERAAKALRRGQADGLGFVFTLDCGFVGIDVDKCVDERGGLSDLACEVLTIPGYAELSPSGRGIHVITRARLDRARKSDKLGLELYSTGRYFTITGQPVPGAE
jgi:putative DNA primase/helicase